MWKRVAGAVCLTLLVGVQAYGQVRVEVGGRDRGDTAARGASHSRRVSGMMGAALATREGTTLGKITDLVVDDRGHVTYVIVRHDTGFIAVPWAAVGGDGTSYSVTANVTPEALKAVTFTESNWPDFASERWTRAARTAWGEAAFRGGRTGTGAGTTPARPGAGADDTRRNDRLNTPPDRRDDRRDRRDDRRNDRSPTTPRPTEVPPGRTPLPTPPQP